MRQVLSLVLTWTMVIGLAPGAPDAASVKTQIAAMPLGTNIELHLKDNQKLRGARGAVLDSGFTLVNARTRERQIAFGDVVSVKEFNAKSHTTRNILIGVGIGLGAVAIALGIMLRCGPFGCGNKVAL